MYRRMITSSDGASIKMERRWEEEKLEKIFSLIPLFMVLQRWSAVSI